MKKLLLLIFLTSSLFSTGFPSYYYKMKSGKKQKVEFINILKPLIDKSNKKVLSQREFIKIFFNYALKNAFRHLKSKDLKTLLYLSKKYKIKFLFDRNEYLRKIDTIPTSLALAQGVLESSWGKSRFVREANNIFGHWTWGEIGLIPLNREEGKTHKIRIFRTLQSSVDAYILNLNTHNAYKDFRKLRFNKRQKGEVLSGIEASNTMVNYSQIGMKYVRILKKVIRDNNFLYYDN